METKICRRVKDYVYRIDKEEIQIPTILGNGKLLILLSRFLEYITREEDTRYEIGERES